MITFENKSQIMIHFKYKTLLIICLLIFESSIPVVQSAPSIKIDKNTIELLNNGLKALISIKQILSTIQTFTELHTMYKEQKQQQQNQKHQSNPISINNGLPIILNSPNSLQPPSTSSSTTIENMNDDQPTLLSMQPISPLPSVASSRPRNNFVQKLFGKFPMFLLPAMLNTKGLNTNKINSDLVQRDPSLGMIKIGEKPPPGLFPETLPYSVSQFEPQSNEQSLVPSSQSPEASSLMSEHLTPTMLDHRQQNNPSLIEHNNHNNEQSQFINKKSAINHDRLMNMNTNSNNYHGKSSSSLTFLDKKYQDNDDNEKDFTETYGYFDHDTLIPYYYYKITSFSTIPTTLKRKWPINDITA